MLSRKAEEMKILIEKGRVVSYGRGDFTINCIRGTLWITWTGSDDVILRAGDKLTVRQHGKLCITSMSESFIHVRRKKMLPCFREMPRITAAIFFRSAASYIRDGGNQSAFGDSVHSLTR